MFNLCSSTWPKSQLRADWAKKPMLLSSSQDHTRPADSSRGPRPDQRPDHRRTGVTPAACMARKRSALAAAGFVQCRMRIQIGRASCRERVCQYVEISVVAVTLKKNNKM